MVVAVTATVKRSDQVMPIPTEQEQHAVWAAVPCAPGWAIPHEIARSSGTSWLITLRVLVIYKDRLACLYADETCRFARYQRAATNTPSPKQEI